MSANGEDLTPPHGMPARELLRQHDSDISALRKGFVTVANEVGQLRGEVAEVKGIALRVEAGLIRVSTPFPPPLPAMRSELPSTVSPGQLKVELRKAARDGERDPTTTAEARVEAVLERVELIRRGRLFNKILWLAITGAAGLAVDRIIIALGHH